MATPEQFAAAVTRIVLNDARFQAVLNGPASGEGSTVVLDGITVPTVSKALADLLGDTPSYATLELANAAEGLGVIFKNTTTNRLQITTA